MQLIEPVAQLLLAPDDPGSNPVISKYYWALNYCQLIWKDEKGRKRGREWPIYKPVANNHLLSPLEESAQVGLSNFEMDSS